jgi:hypothetical protein
MAQVFREAQSAKRKAQKKLQAQRSKALDL